MVKESIFSRHVSPFVLAAFCFVGTLVFVAVGRLLESTLLDGKDDTLAWTVAASFLLLYILFNSVFSLSSKSENLYWLRSIIAYVLLITMGGFFAYWVSGQSIFEAKSFRWIYTVLTIGYVVLLTIFRLMRTIVAIARKQDSRLRGEE